MSNLSIEEKINHEMEDMADKSKGFLGSRYGLWFVGFISFIESMLTIPIVTDPFMVAYILLHRKNIVMAVIVTTITSVLGGLAAYIMAAYFIDLALGMLTADTVTQFYDLANKFKDSTFILGFLGAITPVPFTLAALAAGAIKGNLVLFLLGCFIGRIIRYGIVGYLTYLYGHQALKIARENAWPLTILAVIISVLYFLIFM